MNMLNIVGTNTYKWSDGFVSMYNSREMVTAIFDILYTLVHTFVLFEFQFHADFHFTNLFMSHVSLPAIIIQSRHAPNYKSIRFEIFIIIFFFTMKTRHKNVWSGGFLTYSGNRTGTKLKWNFIPRLVLIAILAIVKISVFLTTSKCAIWVLIPELTFFKYSMSEIKEWKWTWLQCNRKMMMMMQSIISLYGCKENSIMRALLVLNFFCFFSSLV